MAKINIPTVNEKLLIRYIRHSVYLEQLKTGEAKLISRFLSQKVFPPLREKLIRELSSIKNLETLGSIRKIPAKRLTRMLMAVRKTAQAGAVKAEKMLVKRLINVSRFEAKWNADLISKTVPVDIDMTMPSNEVLKNLVTMRPMDGHKLGTWMKGYSTSVRVAMTKQIKVGIATGESLPAIGARINKALNWKGKQAQYIARTAVSNVVHQAREEVFKKNTDIVRKVQFIATLDDRTSLTCINLDGRMYNVGEGPRPPMHFQCRSSIVPITPSWQEFGITDPPAATRASMNGAVPAKMTYKQWIKKQPKAVQVKVLGKKRAELYREGRVKIDRFVGKDLKPLNLKQLARREGIDLKEPDFLPAPPQVKAMSIKGTGKILTSKEIKSLNDWSFQGNHNMVNAQLGRPMDKGWILSDKRMALESASNLEKALIKLDGFDGTVYRGLRFDDEAARQIFLSKLKAGGVWKNKAFISASKKRSVAAKFSEGLTRSQRPVFIEIRGESGRSIAKFSPKPKEMEILFAKGTPFKVDKIVGNKVYLSEITKQAQLKVLPAPPAILKQRMAENIGLIKKFKEMKRIGDPGIGKVRSELFSKGIFESDIIKKKISLIAKRVKITITPKVKIAPTAPTTVTKVGTTFTKTTSKDFNSIVAKQIDSYPENVKAALKNKGVGYKAGNRLTEINPNLAGQLPRGWSAGTTWDSVEGMYDIRNKSISVAETYRPVGQKIYKKVSKSKIKAMLNHETGHGFDRVPYPKGVFHSQTVKFKSAYANDIARLSKSEIANNNLRYFLQKAGAGRSETFAEIFADEMGLGVRSDIRKFFPEVTKYIEDILK